MDIPVHPLQIINILFVCLSSGFTKFQFILKKMKSSRIAWDRGGKVEFAGGGVVN